MPLRRGLRLLKYRPTFGSDMIINSKLLDVTIKLMLFERNTQSSCRMFEFVEGLPSFSHLVRVPSRGRATHRMGCIARVRGSVAIYLRGNHLSKHRVQPCAAGVSSTC
jgi:hypothetical protein